MHWSCCLTWCNSTLRWRISSFTAIGCVWGCWRLGTGNDYVCVARIACDWLVVAAVVIFRGASCHFASTCLMQTHLKRAAQGTECLTRTHLERVAQGTEEGWGHEVMVALHHPVVFLWCHWLVTWVRQGGCPRPQGMELGMLRSQPYLA